MNNSERTKKIKWIILTVLFIMFFFSMMFYDITISFENGMNLLNAIIGGNFPGEYAFESAFYIPVHILFAIWGIPCWILIRLGITDMMSCGCLIWAKGLVALSYFGCLLLTGKLLKKQNSDKIDFWIFMVASSALLFLPTFGMSTYDTFELFFVLLAIKSAADDVDGISVKTCLMLSVAVSIKFFMFFLALAIILVKEKRVIGIIKDFLLIMIIPAMFFVFAQIFIRTSSGANSGELTVGFVHRYFSIVLNGGLYDISLFFVLTFGSLLVCYLQTAPKSEQEFLKQISWIAVLQFMAMFLFVKKNEPQWIVFLVPFIVLAVSSNNERFENNLILENLLEVSITIVQIFYFGWQYMSERLFDYLLLKDAPTTYVLRKNVTNGYIILANLGLESFMPVFCAAILCIAAAILVINNPWQKNNNGIIPYKINNQAKLMKVSNIFRLLVICVYFAGVVLIRFVI